MVLIGVCENILCICVCSVLPCLKKYFSNVVVSSPTGIVKSCVSINISKIDINPKVKILMHLHKTCYVYNLLNLHMN